MTNKQLAKQLRDIGNSLFDRTNDPNFKLLLDEASDRLENQSKWISVEDRLPEMYEDVLYFNGCSFGVDFICSDGTWCDAEIHNNPITHWMPLPEAPNMKGGAE